MDGQFFPGQAIQFEGDGIPLTEPVDGSFITSALNAPGGGATTHTFTSRAIGAVPPAGKTRLVVVTVDYVNTGGTAGISGVTIGGVAATLVKQQNSGGIPGCGIYALAVPSGTTATIVVTTATTAFCVIGVYRVVGANSTQLDTQSNTADPINITVNVKAGGYVIGTAQNRNRGTTTWTNLSENFDTDNTSNDYASGADAAPSADGTLAITAVGAIAGNEMAGVAVSYQPA